MFVLEGKGAGEGLSEVRTRHSDPERLRTKGSSIHVALSRVQRTLTATRALSRQEPWLESRA